MKILKFLGIKPSKRYVKGPKHNKSSYKKYNKYNKIISIIESRFKIHINISNRDRRVLFIAFIFV